MQCVELCPEPFVSIATDYRAGVIHLAWAVHRQTGERILLCGCVELLPGEMPPPIPLGERFAKISERYFAYSREIVVSATRALRWFDEASTGRAVRPRDDGAVPDDDAAETFAVGHFEYEPPPPSFLHPTACVPFQAAWHVPARVRQLVTLSNPFEHQWSEKERLATSAWLKAEHDIDLELFPEYAGALHLIAPNPVFRKLFVRRERDTDGNWFLKLAFTPRRGMSVRGLQIILEEERSTGVGLLGVVTVDEPLVRIRLPHQTGALRTRVVDPERGLLFNEGFAVFGVGFRMKTHLVSQTRTVAVDNGDTYQVPLRGGLDNVSEIPSQAPPQPAATLLHAAKASRERRARAAQSQMWFRERVPDAAKALRKLVADAEGRVFICDPYFGGVDVFRLVLAISDSSVPVLVLTSAMHLRRGRRSEYRQLEQKLAEARAMPPANEIEVRVMRGKHPAIHDRFVAIDDVMWMLGSSINNFGGRGTLLTKLTDPEPVLNDLLRVWDESPSLSTWAMEPEES